MKRISVAIALALCVALPASAQLYKWVDANGKVHYTDRPPPDNVKTKQIREAAPPPAPPAAKDGKLGSKTSEPQSLAERDQAFRKRQAEAAKAEEEQAKKDAKAKEKAQYCNRAKAALAGLEAGGRQARFNDKGERYYLTDAQIAQETARVRQNVADNCN